jgi:hypothetical protein
LQNKFANRKAELEADLEAEALTFCWKRKQKRLGWKQKHLKIYRFRITGYPESIRGVRLGVAKGVKDGRSRRLPALNAATPGHFRSGRLQGVEG